MFITYSLLYLLCCKPFRHSLHSDFSFSAFQRNSILSVVSCISLTEKIRSPSQISVAAFFSDQRQARFRFERTPARRNRGVELERRVETTRDSRRKSGNSGINRRGISVKFYKYLRQNCSSPVHNCIYLSISILANARCLFARKRMNDRAIANGSRGACAVRARVVGRFPRQVG